jgi:hypothetical protein
MNRLRNITSGLLLTAALGVSGLAITPASASSVPRPVVTAASASAATVTQHNCGLNAENLVTQCTSLTSNGTHIVSLSGYANHLAADPDSYPDVHIELYGPNGLIKNCATIANWQAGDTTPTCTWTGPSGNVKAGDYCSRTWSEEGTTFRDLANECEPLPFPTPNPKP